MDLNKLLQIRNVLLTHVNDKIKASLAYKFMKYLKATDAEEEFYLKRMQEITAEYGEKDADGKVASNADGKVTIQRDKVEDCKKLLEELGTTNVETPDTKFAIDDLSELKLTIKEMYILDDLITP